MRRSALAIVGMAFLLASCGADAAPQPVTWESLQPAPGAIDVAGPRSDGRLVAAVGGGLQLYDGSGLTPFTSTTGPGAYLPSANEPYLALTPNVRLRKARCSFHRDDLFAIGDNPDRVVRISRKGAASDFAALPSPFLSGITFDRVGTFGNRILVTGTANGRSSLFAIDCRGRVATLTERGPVVEGGIQVAPRGFGRFGGRLIAPDEIHGPIYAFKPDGSVATVATSSLAAGPDIGVEAIGFVPPLRHRGAAYLADRGGQASPHPGTDSILRLTTGQLHSVGVHPGDLLVATEGGADTVAIRCRREKKRCGVRLVAHGPAVTHAEGHIAFIR
jgi:hypothetical protein